MELLIVGSVALDDVRTPLGEARQALGGSAVYSSLAAAFFTPPGLVGVVGQDFSDDHVALLCRRGVDTAGLEKMAGHTFRWKGYYEYDMSAAHTEETQLNVFASFSPKIPAAYQQAPFVFLANIDPELQERVLQGVRNPRFILLDTMNYWIETKREALLRVLSQVTMAVVNDAEARQLSKQLNLIQAARWIQSRGPRGVMIKKGENGALVLWDNQVSLIPAFPLETVKDPTGAGDTFAGGFIGTLAQSREITGPAIRHAAVMGTIMASFTVEDFSVKRLVALQKEDIEERHSLLRELTVFSGCEARIRSYPA